MSEGIRIVDLILLWLMLMMLLGQADGFAALIGTAVRVGVSQVIKFAAKSGLKAAIKTGIKTAAKSGAKAAAKQGAKTAGKNALKQGVKNQLKQAGKQVLDEAKGQIKDQLKEQGKAMLHDAIHGKEIPQEAMMQPPSSLYQGAPVQAGPSPPNIVGGPPPARMIHSPIQPRAVKQQPQYYELKCHLEHIPPPTRLKPKRIIFKVKLKRRRMKRRKIPKIVYLGPPAHTQSSSEAEDDSDSD